MDDLALYNEPDLYDVVMSANPLADAFYLEEARQRRGTVLELACGSGRFSIPLVKAGVRLVGVDLSPAMLEHARAKASQAGVEFETLEADMRSLDLGGRQFDLILITGNSLQHMSTTDEILRCLRAAARHLVNGGALIFDVFNPAVQLLAHQPSQRRLINHFEHGRLGTLTLQETNDYDAASQINYATWYWSAPDKPDFLVTPLHLRQLFPQELPVLVGLGGFRLTARYGDFDRRNFDSRSRRQVCVCEPI